VQFTLCRKLSLELIRLHDDLAAASSLFQVSNRTKVLDEAAGSQTSGTSAISGICCRMHIRVYKDDGMFMLQHQIHTVAYLASLS